MKRFASPILLALTIVALPGCAGGELPEDETGQETFTRTVVRFDAGGHEEVTIQQITRAEQLAEQAARQEAEAQAERMREEGLGESAQAITYDSSCFGSSLWIYDKLDRAGNEICFFGAGTAYLWQYTRWVCSPNWSCFSSDWVNAVRSYWPGNEGGYFQGKVGDLFGNEYFSAWGPSVNAGYWAQHSNAVTLTN